MTGGVLVSLPCGDYFTPGPVPLDPAGVRVVLPLAGLEPELVSAALRERRLLSITLGPVLGPRAAAELLIERMDPPGPDGVVVLTVYLRSKEPAC